jgi:hypothetical protein
MDHRVDGRRLKRIPAHQERMKTENLTQERMPDESRNQPVNRFVRAKPDQVGRDPHHVGERRERLVGQIDERALKNGPRFFHELPIAGHVLGREFLDLGDNLFLVPGVIEGPSIVENDPVIGRHRNDADIIFRPASRQREKLIDEKRRGDDRRPGVIGEPAIMEDRGAAARLVAHLEDRRVVAARLQPDRRRQAPEAGADDQGAGMWARLVGKHGVRR